MKSGLAVPQAAGLGGSFFGLVPGADEGLGQIGEGPEHYDAEER